MASGAVEDYLLNTLDQQERVRLKLLNPLNVGLRLASKYKDATFERLKLLAQDVEALQNIDQQLALFHQEMLRDFEPRLARLDVLLGEMERRGMRFFEETIRIGRIKSLMDSEGVKRTFEREVIGDTPRQIEDEVGRVIDWIVERNLKLWQDISGYIERRQLTRHREGMIGDVGPNFAYNRQALLDSIGRVSREVVGSYNREEESRTIANEIQGAFATTALAQAGAIGLGTLVVTLVSGAAADVTGILLATALAIGGFYVIPRRRRQAKADFEQRINQLRSPSQRSPHPPGAPGAGAVHRPDQRGHRALSPVRAEPAATAQRGPGRAGNHRGRPAPAPSRHREALASLLTGRGLSSSLAWR